MSLRGAVGGTRPVPPPGCRPPRHAAVAAPSRHAPSTAAAATPANNAGAADAAAEAASPASSVGTPHLIRPVVKKAAGLARAPAGGLASAAGLDALPPPPVAVRNLVELAQFAHLASNMSHMHHRRAGYPFATLVDFASDGAGFPIFCLSPLAMHTRNLLEDPRASLVVEMPGWSGLANARVTIFGEVAPLPDELQAAAADLFAAKHGAGVAGGSGRGAAAAPATPGPHRTQQQQQQQWVTGNATHFRMHRIMDIYFVGGFGTVSWIDPADYAAARPDAVATADPRGTLAALNRAHAAAVAAALSRPGEPPADDAAFISVDARGADVRVRRGGDYTVERLPFAGVVATTEDALAATAALLAGGGAAGERARGAV